MALPYTTSAQVQNLVKQEVSKIEPGTQVVANPSGTFSDTLTSIAIDGTSYGISAGGAAEPEFLEFDITSTGEFELTEEQLAKLLASDQNYIKLTIPANNTEFILKRIYKSGTDDEVELMYAEANTAGEDAVGSITFIISKDEEGIFGQVDEQASKQIEANPSRSSDDSLKKIKIGSTVYDFENQFVNLGEFAVNYDSSREQYKKFQFTSTSPNISKMTTAVDAGKIPYFTANLTTSSLTEKVVMIFDMKRTENNITDYYFNYKERNASEGSGILATYVGNAST